MRIGLPTGASGLAARFPGGLDLRSAWSGLDAWRSPLPVDRSPSLDALVEETVGHEPAGLCWGLCLGSDTISPELLEAVARKWGIEGPVRLFQGPLASVEALQEGARLLEAGPVDRVLVGGIDERGGTVMSLCRIDEESDDWPGLRVEVESGPFPHFPRTFGAPVGLAVVAHADASALDATRGPRATPLPTCALTDEASSPGHGMAAILEAVLAVREKQLPPSTGTVPGMDSTFYRNRRRSPWICGPGTPRRAAVLTPAVALAWQEAGATARLVAEWPAELLLLSAPTLRALREQIARLRQRLAGPEASASAYLADLSFTLARATPSRHRVALIARDTRDLDHKLDMLDHKLAGPATAGFKTRQGLFYGDSAMADPGRTTWIFPGQGAQYAGMGSEAACCFPGVREWMDRFAEVLDPLAPLPASRLLLPPLEGLDDGTQDRFEQTLASMEGGAQAAFVVMLALNELLASLRVPCDAMLGYSNGENAALVASGVMRLDREGVLRCMALLKAQAARLDESREIPTGTMLAVSLASPEAREVLASELASTDPVYLALDNCPHQIVLFGSRPRIEKVAERLGAAGALCVPLPFSRAYHTPLFEPSLKEVEVAYEGVDLGPGRVTVYSCSSAAPFPSEAGSIRALALGQWARPVRFRETIERLYAEGVRTFVEAGPGGKLTGFVRDTLRDRRDVSSMASVVEGRSDLQQIQELVAQFFTRGFDVDLSPFFAHRPVRRLDPDEPEEGPGPSGSASAASGTTRAVLVERHFELMRSFLEGQARVMRSVLAARQQAGFHAAGPRLPEGSPRPVRRASPPPPPSLPPSVSPPAVPAPRGGKTLGMEAAPPARDRGQRQRWPMLIAFLEHDERTLRAVHHFSRASDPFLLDHTLGRRVSSRSPDRTPLPVVPFTVNMELACEAAARLLEGRAVVTEVRDVRGYRWLALDRQELHVDVRAEKAHAADEVHVRLFDAGYEPGSPRHLSFESTVSLAEDYPAPPTPLDVVLTPPLTPRWTVEKFYELCLFHGPSLQSLRRLRAVSAHGIEADLRVPPTSRLFGSVRFPDFEIPAPTLDAAMQLAGFWLVEQSREYFGVFPFHIGRYRQFGPSPADGFELVCRGRLRAEDAVVTGDFDFIGPDGRVLARLEDVRLRYFAFPKRYIYCLYWPHADTRLSTPWIDSGTPMSCWRLDLTSTEFLADGGGIWRRALAHVALGRRELEQWYDLSEQGPQRERWLLGRVVLKDALRHWAREAHGLELFAVDVEVLPDAVGRLRVSCAELAERGPLPDVSLANSGLVYVAAIGEPGTCVGVHLEHFEGGTSPEHMRAVLGDLPGGERALSCAWCAREAFARAVGPMGDAVRVVSLTEDLRQAEVRCGDRSFAVRIRANDREVFAACQLPLDDVRHLCARPPSAGTSPLEV